MALTSVESSACSAQRAVEVAADREHDHQPLVGVAGALDQRVEERLALGLVATGDEDLLELIDQEHQALAGREPLERVGDPGRGVLAPRLGHRPGEGPRELGERVLARAHHRPPPALRAGDDPVGERRQEAGAHGRGLAAARGADHREQGRADQAGDELGDQALAAEEVLGVGGVERRQAAEGADLGLRGIRRLVDGVEAGPLAGRPAGRRRRPRARPGSRAARSRSSAARPAVAASRSAASARAQPPAARWMRSGTPSLSAISVVDGASTTPSAARRARRSRPPPPRAAGRAAAAGRRRLQQGGERRRALLVVMKDADHERPALGLAGERPRRPRARRRGVVGVVEHQQRRSVARARPRRRSPARRRRPRRRRRRGPRRPRAGPRPRARPRAASCRSPPAPRPSRRRPGPRAPRAQRLRSQPQLALAPGEQRRAALELDAAARRSAAARRGPGPGRGSAPGGAAARARARPRSARSASRRASR